MRFKKPFCLLYIKSEVNLDPNILTTPSLFHSSATPTLLKSEELTTNGDEDAKSNLFANN